VRRWRRAAEVREVQWKMKPKKCKGCGRPVRETVGGSGYCKKCIDKARPEKKG
jgi:hypothetical protein